MARVRPANRMDQLLTAAATVFMQKGLVRARMSEIAGEMGRDVSRAVGTVVDIKIKETREAATCEAPPQRGDERRGKKRQFEPIFSQSAYETMLNSEYAVGDYLTPIATMFLQTD